MKTVKVGSWYNKFDNLQKDALKHAIDHELKEYNTYTVSEKRKFLTAAKKIFKDDIKEYNALSAKIKLKDNTVWVYSNDTNRFYQVS